MLEIADIKKDYVLKDQTVTALKGVSICFRRNEFVSILGPSGCGKTTLLNIIGGLDKYTSGDLIIEGTSTKDYKDKDWDNYRNHRVGFVFQSYNLIPHQTVVENVELALTLSGIKKAERRKRAIEVLEKVGLGDKLKSRPNQLSGGQMQRVAIARALVNDPEIILADEPTGALDSKTSVQIMDLLKEVSENRLVIMVTHNPELAEKYSSRIVRLLDGEVIEDSNPYRKKEADKEIAKHRADQEKQAQNEEQGFKKTQKKKSMSIFTAMFLSLKNLLTKKGRTILVAFAGSIGILGIALILAVSAGMTNYIDTMQSESLSSYPVSVASLSVDIDEATKAFMSNDKQTTEKDEIEVYNVLDSLIKFGEYNYISPKFVEYVDNYYKQENKRKLLNDYSVSYASEMNLIRQLPNEAMPEMPTYSPINSQITFSAFGGSTSSTFFEGLNNEDYVRSMYRVVGKYPTEKNEIALVLNSSPIDVSTLESFGISVPQPNEDGKYEPVKFSDIIDHTTYRLLLNNGYYKIDADNLGKAYYSLNGLQLTKDLEESYEAYMKRMAEIQTNLGKLYNGGFYLEDESRDKNWENEKTYLDLTITAVLVLKDGVSGNIFSNGLMYSTELAKFYHENCQNSDIVKQIKGKYLNESGEFSDGARELNFPVPYSPKISELNSLKQFLDINTEENDYQYPTPKKMDETLKGKFGIALTDEELIDLYLQIYGASNVPNGIHFYVKSFDGRDDVKNMIEAWNNKKDEYDIIITDSTSFITSMLKSLVDIISYVLIAFAAISLVVSSIMIAIITYTSVIERTKEIGVLRSVGASKRDVSRVFNAETIIIGLLAGVLGVAIAGLITIPISLILKSLTGVGGLAVLNPLPCVILIAISVVLTLLAGLVPARIASKKDPVLALRTE